MGGFKFTYKKVNKYVSPHTLFVTTLQNYKKHKMGTPPPTIKQHRLGFSWNLSYENTMLQPTPTEIRIFIILRSCPFLSFSFCFLRFLDESAPPPLQKQCYVPVISLCCYVMKKKISLSVKSIQKKRFSC